jgi:hypothetical protein
LPAYGPNFALVTRTTEKGWQANKIYSRCFYVFFIFYGINIRYLEVININPTTMNYMLRMNILMTLNLCIENFNENLTNAFALNFSISERKPI